MLWESSQQVRSARRGLCVSFLGKKYNYTRHLIRHVESVTNVKITAAKSRADK
jgi:hypothetical protein